MHRYKPRIFICIGIVLIFAICTSFAILLQPNKSLKNDMVLSTRSIIDISEIIMKTQMPSYPLDLNTIKIEILNNSNEEIHGDNEFELERYINNAWYVVDFTKDNEINALGWLLSPGEKHEMVINIVKHYDLPLQPGKYRILKCISTKWIASYFDIK